MAGPLDEPQQEVDPNTGRVIVIPNTTAPTNAEVPLTQSDGWYDAGLDAPDRTLEQTQSIQYDDPYVLNGQSTIPEATYGGDDPYVFNGQSTIPPSMPLENVAVSAPDDGGKNIVITALNNGASSYSTTSTTIINPTPNPLDQYESYTYNASVYLLSPKQYEQLVITKQKNISGYQLLFQTGGATATNKEIRNPWFTEDFYIDHITLENVFPGKATRAAHMVTSLKFTVVEPSNITLLDRLYAAVQDHVAKGGSGAINYASVTYLMVIRFYGYDQAGNLVKATANPEVSGRAGAVIEKFIPFSINSVSWGVSNKLVSYDFDCTPTGQIIGLTTNRGTVPYDIEFSASSVKDFLSGSQKFGTVGADSANPGGTTTASAVATTYADFDIPVGTSTDTQTATAPSKASTAPNKKQPATSGLMQALNEYQQEMVKQGKYKFADEYYIEFLDPEIASATLVLPGTDKNKAATPMAQPSSQNPKTLVNQPQTDHSIRNIPITAGQQIVQIIELAIRNSSYILNQANSIKNEEKGIEEANTKANATKPLDWFLITTEAVQKADQYDTERNDYAYKITYRVSRYKVPNFDSRYFGLAQFPGVHKSYKYWFTGDNVAVLDYQANFNALYTQTITGDNPKNPGQNDIRKKVTSSMRDLMRYNVFAASTESKIGAKNQGNEIGANASEYLYDIANLGECRLRILGDPAWIQQGSVFAGLPTGGAFLPDGTINFDRSQVFFEIAWQRPEDYSLTTGLADPYSRTQQKTGDREPIQSFVYLTTQVINEFKGGKFEQTLIGSIYPFEIPSGTNAAPTAPKKGATDAGAGRSASEYAAVDPRRLDLRSGQDVITAVQNSLSKVKGVVPTPGISETPISTDAGTYTDYDMPAVAPAPPAEPITSNGEATVADFYYEPPAKLGEDNGPTDTPPQEMYWEP